MGVWERSPAGIAIALENEGLVESFRRALPDFATEDVVGSPYCIRDYRVDAHLGGPEGLAAARAALARARHRPDPRLRAEPRRARPPVDGGAPRVLRPRQRRRPRARPGVVRARRRPRPRERPRPVLPGLARRRAAERLLARPARAPSSTRSAAIAAQCDGVRCDMAMLMMNDVFERTWGERAGPRPADDYWPTRDPRRQARPSRLRLRGRGLLGPRVGAPAAGLRLLLRQAPLRPARARGRRGGARAPDGRASATRSGSSASSRTTTSRARRRRSRRRRRAPPPSRR